MHKALRAGQIAEAAGVNLETLRYYERRGLLAKPQRSPGGHRLYSPETVTALRTIKTAQRLGFSLDEVAELLEVSRSGSRDARGMHTRTVAKLAEVEARLADLKAIRAVLRPAVGVEPT